MGLRDGGFTIEFDGKKNTVMRSGEVKEYPIGGIAAEYARLRPTKLKEILLTYEKLEAAPTVAAPVTVLLEYG